MQPILSSIMSTENYQTYNRDSKDFCSYERSRLEQIKTNLDNKIQNKKLNYQNAQSVLIGRIPVEINDQKKIDQLKQNIMRSDPIKFKNLNGVSVINPITQQFLNVKSDIPFKQDINLNTKYNEFQSKKRDDTMKNQHWQNSQEESNLWQTKKRYDGLNMQQESTNQIQLFQSKKKNDNIINLRQEENLVDAKEWNSKKRVEQYFDRINEVNQNERKIFQHKRQVIDSYQDYMNKLNSKKDQVFSQKQRDGHNQKQSPDFPFPISSQDNLPILYKQFQKKQRNHDQILNNSVQDIQLFQGKSRVFQDNIKNLHNQSVQEIQLMQGKQKVPNRAQLQNQNDSLAELMQSKNRTHSKQNQQQKNIPDQDPQLFKSKKRQDSSIPSDNMNQDYKLFQSKLKNSQNNTNYL